MPYCTKCGKEVPPEGAFCPNCGAYLSTRAEEYPSPLPGIPPPPSAPPRPTYEVSPPPLAPVPVVKSVQIPLFVRSASVLLLSFGTLGALLGGLALLVSRILGYQMALDVLQRVLSNEFFEEFVFVSGAAGVLAGFGLRRAKKWGAQLGTVVLLIVIAIWSLLIADLEAYKLPILPFALIGGFLLTATLTTAFAWRALSKRYVK